MMSNLDKVQSEIKKCRQALDDALFNISDGRHFTAINRLYYAAFYILMAYFINQKILVKSHKGINIKLHDELVNKNIISKQDGEIFDNLLKLRGEFDYGDYAVFSTNELKILYTDAVNFIQKIESLINMNEQD